jgi:tetratricopeptide (TPR) repeat protein
MKYPTLLLLLLLPLAGFSQYQELEDGRMAAEQGDYKTAIRLLEPLVQHPPSNLAETSRAQAAYFLGLSLIICWQKEATGSRATKSACENALPRAWENLKISKKDAAWQTRTERELPILQANLLYVAFNTMLSAKSMDESDKQSRREIALATEPYIQAALEIGESWRALDLEGQRLLLLDRQPDALQQFTKATQAYEKKKPEVPEFTVGNSFFRAGEIHLKREQYPQTLDFAQKGQTLVQSEWERYKKLQAADPNFKVEDAREQYEQVRNLLVQLELGVYMASPEIGAKALPRMEEILQRDPDNVSLLTNLARYAQEVNPQKAMDLYDRILELEPDNFHACFNRGALHLNKAAELSQELQRASDIEQQFAMSRELKSELRKAFPFMERAHELNPGEIGVLDALIQAATVLEDEAAFGKYSEKRKKLKRM